MPKRDKVSREREKKISGPISAHSGPRQENSEKITKKLKTSFRQYFYPKRYEIGQETDKKILVRNSVHT